MENTACLICGSKHYKLKAVVKDFEYRTFTGRFTYVRCVGCNHLYLNPRPTLEMLPQLYLSTYYTVNKDSPLFLKGFTYKRKLNSDVQRILKYVTPVSSILDVGCGNLQRLITLRNSELGKNLLLFGLDLQFSKESIQLALRNNITLLEWNIELSTVLSKNKFDLVIMSQLLEHLYHPLKALEQCRSVMKEDALLLIETPNPGGLDYFLFKDKFWGGYHCPRHFNLFSPAALSLLVKKVGFTVVKKGFLPSVGFWIISLRNAFGLSSYKYGGSVLEGVNFRNIPLVTIFSIIDYFMIIGGSQTSNQYIVCKINSKINST